MEELREASWEESEKKRDKVEGVKRGLWSGRENTKRQQKSVAVWQQHPRRPGSRCEAGVVWQLKGRKSVRSWAVVTPLGRAGTDAWTWGGFDGQKH